MAFYVYLLASKEHGALYLGVTNDLVRRVYEHRTKAVRGFTKRYDVGKLVWFEIYVDVNLGHAREKELEKWRGDWKIRLIEEKRQAGSISKRQKDKRHMALDQSVQDAIAAGYFKFTLVVMGSGPAPRGASRNDEVYWPGQAPT